MVQEFDGFGSKVLLIGRGNIECEIKKKKKKKKKIFAWEVMQGERQQCLDFVNNVFCKTHKSRKICEAFFYVAKCQRKRCRIERDSQRAT